MPADVRERTLEILIRQTVDLSAGELSGTCCGCSAPASRPELSIEAAAPGTRRRSDLPPSNRWRSPSPPGRLNSSSRKRPVSDVQNAVPAVGPSRALRCDRSHCDVEPPLIGDTGSVQVLTVVVDDPSHVAEHRAQPRPACTRAEIPPGTPSPRSMTRSGRASSTAGACLWSRA